MMTCADKSNLYPMKSRGGSTATWTWLVLGIWLKLSDLMNRIWWWELALVKKSVLGLLRAKACASLSWSGIVNTSGTKGKPNFPNMALDEKISMPKRKSKSYMQIRILSCADHEDLEASEDQNKLHILLSDFDTFQLVLILALWVPDTQSIKYSYTKFLF